jgi:bifunctional non-homologous end joining protein LigD
MYVDYVLHLHVAQRAGEHYDLRIKYPKKKKLASWALPKAKIPKEGERYLAIKTDDHDMYWLKFSGEIAEGSYGAGTIKIEQSGKLEVDHWTTGSIVFTVTGNTMNGQYALIRIKPKVKTKEDTWIFIKTKKR